MAQIVPFPLARRIDFVDRHARMIASLSPDAGEAHLARQLKIQGDTLARKSVSAAAIAVELKSLESAIRAALWRAVITPSGGVQ